MKDDFLYLDHIRECIEKIDTFTRLMSQEEFHHNIAIQDAVIRNLEVIGEATKKLSNTFTTNHPEIPWSDMAGMRDRLIHHYFDIDIDVLWKTIEIDLPVLKSLISKL
jgi:uncharacterized protein with HEPN domain